ncbi:LysR family transcriptional regulator [Pseudonocardia acidicola]|uniref:LysR family transcriptional regulator n=1 Tax=Pseudonocardia acidicola TaxID=2724939 RepID=UPI0030843DD3
MTRAAARLHLTQPPLRAEIARLEHELGVAPLIRHRRGGDLTGAGRHLLTHARTLLADVEAVVRREPLVAVLRLAPATPEPDAPGPQVARRRPGRSAGDRLRAARPDRSTP